MSETIQITLIIVMAILIILYLFRDKLSLFNFKAGKDGVEGTLETHDASKKATNPSKAKTTNPSVEITGNSLKGTGNEINIERDNVRVRDNEQTGKDNKINVSNEGSDRS